jgi:hypothetical protein
MVRDADSVVLPAMPTAAKRARRRNYLRTPEIPRSLCYANVYTLFSASRS